jgi:biopolymer transport protein ExbD
MSVKIQKGSALAALSLTPLIDVVFLLLIFFLVATRFAEEDREIEVQLPSASTARPMIDRPPQLTVNIDVEGRWLIGRNYVTAVELDDRLRQAAVDNPGRQSVVIRADRNSPVQSTITVIDLCHRYQLRNYRITTER